MRTTCIASPSIAHARGNPLLRLFAPVLIAILVVAGASAAMAQEVARKQSEVEGVSSQAEFGKLFDAVVDAIQKSFFDRERLTAVNWPERARQERQNVIEAPSLEEAARRINALIGELKTSHTVLLTPDDVDYYVLKDVFWRAGSPYAGIGLFSTRIGGRDFVDLLLEGYPADHAGLKVGDEIVSVDGKPYHPIRSFRGKIGKDAAVGIRRTEGGPVVTVDVDVVGIAPLAAFSEATLTSTRVIEREGRRIGYVHVWASIGDAQTVLATALVQLGIGKWPEIKRQATMAPVDGLIVDMRGKIGGVVTMATRYLEIIDPRGPDISARGSTRAPTSMRGRTAVLIDHHTRSTAEVFVHSYKRERQGPLIGTTTAAAVSGGQAMTMPGDNLLHVAVSGLVVDGDVIEGNGVAPDVLVQRPLPYSGGADPVLDAAVDLLASRVPRSMPVQQDNKGGSQ